MADAMLQRHCARYIYVIPDGLRELMSDISREVLRTQPEDMYTFIADYLDALMITRENARVAARLVQSLTEMATTTATFLEETGMSRDEIDNIVTAIQKTFKKSIDSEAQKERLSEEVEEANVVSDILHEITINREQAELAAIIIQQAYRRFKERKEREKELLAGMVDWRVAARSAIQLYRRTGVTNEEANRAATLIKAAYKGYYTRRLMKHMTTTENQDINSGMEYMPSGREEEGEGTDYEAVDLEEDENDDRQRSVKINFDTVRPHVDFDTSGPHPKTIFDQPEAVRQASTTSTIAKHSLRLILDSAFDRIPKQSVILEEEGLESMSDEPDKIIIGSLADQALPVASEEVLVSNQEVAKEVEEPLIIKEQVEPLGGGTQEDTFQQGADDNEGQEG